VIPAAFSKAGANSWYAAAKPPDMITLSWPNNADGERSAMPMKKGRQN
jgi:hypothetical protein